MKDYKRLTFKRSKNASTASYEELLNRLTELEDKIENGTLVPTYSVVKCSGAYCVCTVDTDNLLTIDKYETKAEALEKLKKMEQTI